MIMNCKHAFQKHVEIAVPATFGGENGVFNVPKDKCLVIEYISGEAFMPTGQKALFGIITTAGGTQVRHYLGTHALGAFGGDDYYWVSGPASIYADPGTEVTLRADRDIATGTATFRMSISGHLE
jgi:hypothetical protein